MNYYLARDKSGRLFLYSGDPKKRFDSWFFRDVDYPFTRGFLYLGDELYPEIKWEDKYPTNIGVLFYSSKSSIYDLGNMDRIVPYDQILRSSKIEEDTGVMVLSGLAVMETIMFFAARDKDGSLFLYKGCPKRYGDTWEHGEHDYKDDKAGFSCFCKSTRIFKLGNFDLPSVKWEDEYPARVSFEIRKIG